MFAYKFGSNRKIYATPQLYAIEASYTSNAECLNMTYNDVSISILWKCLHIFGLQEISVVVTVFTYNKKRPVMCSVTSLGV